MPVPAIHPLTLEDRRWLEPLLLANCASGDPLAAYSFPYHFIWQGLFRYEWMELAGHRCLLAGNQEGSFLALPPLGPDPGGSATTQAFAFLADRNRNPALTRIENTPESLANRCRAQGYRVVPKGADYLYQRDALVGLHGDRYKGQRVSYNHCVKGSRPMFRAFRPEDIGACLDLFRQWQQGVKQNGASDLARHLAADAESAHRTGIHYAAELGLVGRVVEIEGRVAAYTFGYPLTSTSPSPLLQGRGEGEGAVFCILFEIADRTVKGLSQFIFRELCRELEGYELINTMDDSGLEGLRRAKLAYNPLRLIESYIVSP